MFNEFYLSVYNQLFFRWILSHQNQYQKDYIHCFVETDNEKQIRASKVDEAFSNVGMPSKESPNPSIIKPQNKLMAKKPAAMNKKWFGLRNASDTKGNRLGREIQPPNPIPTP